MKRKLLALFIAVAMFGGIVALAMQSSETPITKEAWEELQATALTTEKKARPLIAEGLEGGLTAEYDGVLDRPGETADPDSMVKVIVELDGEPLKDSAFILMSGNQSGSGSESYGAAKQQEAAMRTVREVAQATVANLPEATIRYSYDTIFNGFSAEVRYSDIETVKSMPNVKNVFVAVKYDMPQPQDTVSNGSIGTSSMWDSGYDGDGMRIAIIDSGVDYSHDLFSTLSAANMTSMADMKTEVQEAVSTVGLSANITGNGDYYSNPKVIYGYDYSDLDNDPMDDEIGHGTHVAGIAAANTFPDLDTIPVQGVAYQAQILAMKVFPNSYDDVILAAVEDSYKLGADSINLSLGTISGFTSYPENDGTQRFQYDQVFANCRENAAFVSVSAGNDSYTGTGSFLSELGFMNFPYASNQDYGHVGNPSTNASAVSVASVENESQFVNYFMAYGRKIPYTDANMTLFAQQMEGIELEFVDVGYGTVAEIINKDLEGKIALASLGQIHYLDKLINAKSYGAAGVIIYSNANDGLGWMTMIEASYIAPGIFITKEDGEFLIAQMDKSTGSGVLEEMDKTATMFAENAVYGGYISGFSSYGVTPDLKLKPDVSAVGGNILSTTPGNTFGVSSGTSMASPQIAGAAALIKQYVIDNFPAITEPRDISILVENILMSTASPIKSPNEGDGIERYYPVQAQGAGVVDLKGAVSTETVLYHPDSHKSKVELGDNVNPDNIAVTFVVENMSATLRTYTLDAVLLVDSASPVYLVGDETNDTPLYLTRATADVVNKLRGGMSVNGTVNVAVTGGEYLSEVSRITVQAGAKATVTVTFALSQEKKAELDQTFTNGYLVDGYVFLDPIDTDSYMLSIPFLGFVGDWTKAPIFDTGTYYDSVYTTSEIPFYWRNLCYTSVWYSTSIQPQATCYNHIIGALAPTDHNSFAPPYNKNDPDTPYTNYLGNFGANLYTMRNIVDFRIEITNQNGDIVRTFRDDTSYVKSYHDGFGLSSLNFATGFYGAYSWNGRDGQGRLVDDGWYTYTVYGTLGYDGPYAEQSWSIDVYVDKAAPTAAYKVTESNGRTYVTVEMADDHYLMYAEVSLMSQYGDLVKTFDYIGFVGYREFEFEPIDVTGYLRFYDNDINELLKCMYAAAIDYTYVNVLESPLADLPQMN